MDDNSKAIRLLLAQAKTLEKNINRTLSDATTESHSRYVSFKTYARTYNFIARQTEELFNLKENSFTCYNVEAMGNHMSTLWGTQKEIMESVALEAGLLSTYLEEAISFSEDAFDNLTNLIKSKLRAVIFKLPEKEVDIQNAIESLLIGRALCKGIDYDRESGKFEFSGKEYIPDFILPKLDLCIEVKLSKTGRKSRIIDEINADITAYSTKYDRLLFVVYDLGSIRDEDEFRRDIENAGASIKLIIVKH